MKLQRNLGWLLVATLPAALLVAGVDRIVGSREAESRGWIVYMHYEPCPLRVLFDTWSGHQVTLKVLLGSVPACLLGIIFLVAYERPPHPRLGCPRRSRRIARSSNREI